APPSGVELLVCAPFTHLARLAVGLAGTPFAVGGQDLAGEVAEGAYTGEINGAMLADVSCSLVIVGHSERRIHHGEGDALIARKVAAAIAAGLQPILCVGETLAERKAGTAEQVLQQQLQMVLHDNDAETLARLVIAYEPVWAIGTGHSATPDQAQAMHAFMRAQIAAKDVKLARSIRLLYGGSVKPENAAALFVEQDIDGALVGGASLQATSFMDIARAAA